MTVAGIAPFNEVEYEVVQRGAAKMDDVMPGWVDNIDLHRLRLSSGAACVLGQLFPASCGMPVWLVSGQYASREEFIAQKLQTRRIDAFTGEARLWTLDEAVEAADAQSCRANYDLGRHVVFPTGKEKDRNRECILHGFLSGAEFVLTRSSEISDEDWAEELARAQTDASSYIIMDPKYVRTTYGGLDEAWAKIILERQGKEYEPFFLAVLRGER